MALSFEQAVSQLTSLRSTGNLNATSLRELISALDISASGSVTVLYSGTVNGVSATEIASGLKNDPVVRVIDKTEAAKFLCLYGVRHDLKKALPESRNGPTPPLFRQRPISACHTEWP